jgi:hypothetical protein
MEESVLPSEDKLPAIPKPTPATTIRIAPKTNPTVEAFIFSPLLLGVRFGYGSDTGLDTELETELNPIH